jgi:hypothetical protein
VNHSKDVIIPSFEDQDGGVVTVVLVDAFAPPVTSIMASDFSKVTITPTIA